MSCVRQIIPTQVGGVWRQLLPLLLLTCSVAYGQEGAKRDTSSVSPVPPYWWTRSPATMDSIPPQFLFHVEGDYAFNMQSGNVEGSAHNGSLGLVLRKQRTSLAINGGIAKQTLSLAKGVSEIATTHYMAEATVDHALSPLLDPQVGGFWEHDDAAFIETRLIGYVGVKMTPVRTEAFTLTILPAFGYQQETAILTEEERSFWSPYLEESITWQPLPQFRLKHTGQGLFSLDDPSTYRWSVTNSLEIPITSYFSVMFNHQFRYNSNPIPSDERVKQLTNGVGSISREDLDMTVGVRVQY